MNIAHFTNTYKPNVNGVVRSISTFRKALMAMGNQVFIFAQEAPKGYEESEQDIYRYPGVNIPKFNYSMTWPSSSSINKLLPSLKLDVIHSNHPLLIGDAAAKQAQKLNLPLVFTFHTRYVEYADGYAAYVPHSEAFVEGVAADGLVRYMGHCQHIVTPSDSIKQTLTEYTGVVDRITTIPTGIDLTPFRNADGKDIRQKYKLDDYKTLVSIGRLADEKNWKVLLMAMSYVCQEQDDLRLLLIGDGPQRHELIKFVQELGLTDKVIFTGLVPFHEIPSYLKAADIFFFASVSETQGLVTMEAMAADLPIVAVDATGTRDEVENGVEGLLTENDSHALAGALQQLLDDPHLYTQLKQAAKEKAKSFDMMLQSEKMMQVYEQAVEDRKSNLFIEIDKDLAKRKMKERREARK